MVLISTHFPYICFPFLGFFFSFYLVPPPTSHFSVSARTLFRPFGGVSIDESKSLLYRPHDRLLLYFILFHFSIPSFPFFDVNQVNSRASVPSPIHSFKKKKEQLCHRLSTQGHERALVRCSVACAFHFFSLLVWLFVCCNFEAFYFRLPSVFIVRKMTKRKKPAASKGGFILLEVEPLRDEVNKRCFKSNTCETSFLSRGNKERGRKEAWV